MCASPLFSYAVNSWSVSVYDGASALAGAVPRHKTDRVLNMIVATPSSLSELRKLYGELFQPKCKVDQLIFYLDTPDRTADTLCELARQSCVHIRNEVNTIKNTMRPDDRLPVRVYTLESNRCGLKPNDLDMTTAVFYITVVVMSTVFVGSESKTQWEALHKELERMANPTNDKKCSPLWSVLGSYTSKSGLLKLFRSADTMQSLSFPNKSKLYDEDLNASGDAAEHKHGDGVLISTSSRTHCYLSSAISPAASPAHQPQQQRNPPRYPMRRAAKRKAPAAPHVAAEEKHARAPAVTDAQTANKPHNSTPTKHDTSLTAASSRPTRRIVASSVSVESSVSSLAQASSAPRRKPRARPTGAKRTKTQKANGSRHAPASKPTQASRRRSRSPRRNRASSRAGSRRTEEDSESKTAAATSGSESGGGTDSGSDDDSEEEESRGADDSVCGANYDEVLERALRDVPLADPAKDKDFATMQRRLIQCRKDRAFLAMPDFDPNAFLDVRNANVGRDNFHPVYTCDGMSSASRDIVLQVRANRKLLRHARHLTRQRLVSHSYDGADTEYSDSEQEGYITPHEDPVAEDSEEEDRPEPITTGPDAAPARLLGRLRLSLRRPDEYCNDPVLDESGRISTRLHHSASMFLGDLALALRGLAGSSHALFPHLRRVLFAYSRVLDRSLLASKRGMLRMIKCKLVAGLATKANGGRELCRAKKCSCRTVDGELYGCERLFDVQTVHQPALLLETLFPSENARNEESQQLFARALPGTLMGRLFELIRLSLKWSACALWHHLHATLQPFPPPSPTRPLPDSPAVTRILPISAILTAPDDTPDRAYAAYFGVHCSLFRSCFRNPGFNALSAVLTGDSGYLDWAEYRGWLKEDGEDAERKRSKQLEAWAKSTAGDSVFPSDLEHPYVASDVATDRQRFHAYVNLQSASSKGYHAFMCRANCFLGQVWYALALKRIGCAYDARHRRFTIAAAFAKHPGFAELPRRAALGWALAGDVVRETLDATHDTRPPAAPIHGEHIDMLLYLFRYAHTVRCHPAHQSLWESVSGTVDLAGGQSTARAQFQRLHQRLSAWLGYIARVSDRTSKSKDYSVYAVVIAATLSSLQRGCGALPVSCTPCQQVRTYLKALAAECSRDFSRVATVQEDLKTVAKPTEVPYWSAGLSKVWRNPDSEIDMWMHVAHGVFLTALEPGGTWHTAAVASTDRSDATGTVSESTVAEETSSAVATSHDAPLRSDKKRKTPPKAKPSATSASARKREDTESDNEESSAESGTEETPRPTRSKAQPRRRGVENGKKKKKKGPKQEEHDKRRTRRKQVSVPEERKTIDLSEEADEPKSTRAKAGGPGSNKPSSSSRGCSNKQPGDDKRTVPGKIARSFQKAVSLDSTGDDDDDVAKQPARSSDDTSTATRLPAAKSPRPPLHDPILGEFPPLIRQTPLLLPTSGSSASSSPAPLSLAPLNGVTKSAPRSPSPPVTHVVLQAPPCVESPITPQRPVLAGSHVSPYAAPESRPAASMAPQPPPSPSSLPSSASLFTPLCVTRREVNKRAPPDAGGKQRSPTRDAPHARKRAENVRQAIIGCVGLKVASGLAPEFPLFQSSAPSSSTRATLPVSAILPPSSIPCTVAPVQTDSLRPHTSPAIPPAGITCELTEPSHPTHTPLTSRDSDTATATATATTPTDTTATATNTPSKQACTVPQTPTSSPSETANAVVVVPTALPLTADPSPTSPLHNSPSASTSMQSPCASSLPSEDPMSDAPHEIQSSRLPEDLSGQLPENGAAHHDEPHVRDDHSMGAVDAENTSDSYIDSLIAAALALPDLALGPTDDSSRRFADDEAVLRGDHML